MRAWPFGGRVLVCLGHTTATAHTDRSNAVVDEGIYVVLVHNYSIKVVDFCISFQIYFPVFYQLFVNESEFK